MPLEEKDQLPYSKSTFLLLFFMQTWICFHLGEIDTYPSHCSCKELDQCWFSIDPLAPLLLIIIIIIVSIYTFLNIYLFSRVYIVLPSYYKEKSHKDGPRY